MGNIINRRRVTGGSKIDWEKQYLTFIPVEDAVFSWTENATSGHLEYSINGGQTWVTIADGESTPTITAGSKVIWRGDLKPNTSSTTGGVGTFSTTANYHAYGNTMSLLFYNNYYGSQLNSTEYNYVFFRLFFGDTHILSAPLLPATTLVQSCYQQMFLACTALTKAPELPATTLSGYCYQQMFENCTSLTTAPLLPATTLKFGCYIRMFTGCSSLISAPELAATTLTGQCYAFMFRGCHSLSYIKCLATDISASNCTNVWMSGVASTGTFVKDATMEDWSTGASGIPSGWTVVDDNS